MSAAPDKSHSVLSPSGADRWLTCVGSLAACKGLPEQRTSERAACGTAKHGASERVLREGYGALPTIGSIVEADGFKFEVDEEFLEHIGVYIAYVQSRPGRKLYEVWLSTSHMFGVPMGQGGTSDCVHLDAEAREIEIIDAKFGYVPVSAQHRQLRIYGAAALKLYELEGQWDTVRCTIVQPLDASEQIKTHVYTRDQIHEFIGEIRRDAQLAYRLYESPPADLLKYLTPSAEACTWCPIRDNCKARSDKVVSLFGDVTAATPDTVLLSDERIAELYAQSEDIAAWAAGIAAEAESRAKTGRAIPGYKLIYGRKGSRAYKPDSDAAVEGVLSMALGEDQMYAPRKLLSPTQVEKALKDANASGLYEQIAPYVTQADAKLRLVPLAAKGDPVTVTPVSFEAVAS